jgi:hypothetical protein
MVADLTSHIHLFLAMDSRVLPAAFRQSQASELNVKKLFKVLEFTYLEEQAQEVILAMEH